MSTQDSATPRSSWHADLQARDRAVHSAVNDDALALEVVTLRRRNAELAAALAQARAGNVVRDSLRLELITRAEELAAELEQTRAEAARAREGLAAVLGSVRWRLGGVASRAARTPAALARRWSAR